MNNWHNNATKLRECINILENQIITLSLSTETSLKPEKCCFFHLQFFFKIAKKVLSNLSPQLKMNIVLNVEARDYSHKKKKIKIKSKLIYKGEEYT